MKWTFAVGTHHEQLQNLGNLQIRIIVSVALLNHLRNTIGLLKMCLESDVESDDIFVENCATPLLVDL